MCESTVGFGFVRPACEADVSVLDQKAVCSREPVLASGPAEAGSIALGIVLDSVNPTAEYNTESETAAAGRVVDTGVVGSSLSGRKRDVAGDVKSDEVRLTWSLLPAGPAVDNSSDPLGIPAAWQFGHTSPAHHRSLPAHSLVCTAFYLTRDFISSTHSRTYHLTRGLDTVALEGEVQESRHCGASTLHRHRNKWI